MLLFCPNCANMLTVQCCDVGYENCFRCPTCPYEHSIDTSVLFTTELKRKEVDDVLGGDDAWENVDKTAAECPKCGNDFAFFFQMQTRSADEPMTTFYRCTKMDCKESWRE